MMESQFDKLKSFDNFRIADVIEDLSLMGHDDDVIHPAIQKVLLDEVVDNEEITYVYVLRETLREIIGNDEEADEGDPDPSFTEDRKRRQEDRQRRP